MEGLKIAVIGAGIIGLSSAIAIKERIPGIDLTVLADCFTPNTTGDGAAGLWMPYLLGTDTSLETQKYRCLRSWAQQTFDYLNKLYISEQASEAGICLTSGYYVSSKGDKNPFWKDIPFGYRPMSLKELHTIGAEEGVAFTTFITQCTKLLPYLTRRLLSYGAKIQETKIRTLQELSNYDIVVNCTGVHAGQLTGDKEIHPIRGQVTRVLAPWVKTFVVSDEFYVIPNLDTVVLGGTSQKDNWNLEPNPTDKDTFMQKCLKIIPSLKDAKIIKEWVGLRPGRKSVRIEREILRFGSKTLHVIHNYGHGGSGITIFWGCAENASQLVQDAMDEIIQQQSLSTIKSKI